MRQMKKSEILERLNEILNIHYFELLRYKIKELRDDIKNDED